MVGSTVYLSLIPGGVLVFSDFVTGFRQCREYCTTRIAKEKDALFCGTANQIVMTLFL